MQSVDALSPSTLAPLTRAVSALYESCVLREAPGFAALRRMVAAPPIATVSSLGGVARFLAHHYQMNVVAVDVGASSTELAGATAKGEYLPAVHPMAGVGAGGGQLARAVGVENILRWISAPVDEDDLREYILTHILRQRLLPATPLALEIQYALAREAIRLAMHAPGTRMAGLHPMDIVLGTGGVLAHVAHPADAALILLDGLQPRGITSLVLDSAQIAGMLGNLAMVSPDIAADLSSNDAVPLLLGSAISTEGDTPEGELALRVVLEFLDGRQEVAEVTSVGERQCLQREVVPVLDEEDNAHATPSSRITSTTRGAASGPWPRISACLPAPSGTTSRSFSSLDAGRSTGRASTGLRFARNFAGTDG